MKLNKMKTNRKMGICSFLVRIYIYCDKEHIFLLQQNTNISFIVVFLYNNNNKKNFSFHRKPIEFNWPQTISLQQNVLKKPLYKYLNLKSKEFFFNYFLFVYYYCVKITIYKKKEEEEEERIIKIKVLSEVN